MKNLLVSCVLAVVVFGIAGCGVDDGGDDDYNKYFEPSLDPNVVQVVFGADQVEVTDLTFTIYDEEMNYLVEFSNREDVYLKYEGKMFFVAVVDKDGNYPCDTESSHIEWCDMCVDGPLRYNVEAYSPDTIVEYFEWAECIAEEFGSGFMLRICPPGGQCG